MDFRRGISMSDDIKIYGIHRCEKRHVQSIYGLQSENNRDDKTRKDFPNSDIDYDKTNQNFFIKKSDNWLEDIKSRIGDIKYKRDAVIMLDAIYTASPEWFQDKTQDEVESYFGDCIKWHLKTYCHNDKSLVINAVIHYDEKTPHLHITSVPITEDNRLCAKEIMGNRKDYSNRQDSFYEEVTKERNMERGEIQEPNKRRKHRNKQEMVVEELKNEIQSLNDKIDSQYVSIQAQHKEILTQQKTIDEQKEEIERLKHEKECLKHEKENQIKENQRTFEAAQRLEQREKALKTSVNALEASEKAFMDKKVKRIQETANRGNTIAKNGISEVKGQGEADTRYGNP